MIRKSKNNENKPDFDVMFNEVQEEIQEKDAEQDIVSRVFEIKQLSTDIDKATTAVINAKLYLESSIRQTQREEGVLGAAVNTISDKVDTINEHIDQVMEDAPTKLKYRKRSILIFFIKGNDSCCWQKNCRQQHYILHFSFSTISNTPPVVAPLPQ